MFADKGQIIDLKELSRIEPRLVAVLDGKEHVSIRPGTGIVINTILLNEWANTRGSAQPHQLTINLKAARIGEVKKPKN